jgi:hypothetical protein
MFYISLTPILPIIISIYYILKKPHKPKNLSMAMSIPLLAFCIFAFFGNSIAQDGNYFWQSFGILTIYCITIVPVLMHLASAIRQRLKMEREDKEKQNG